MSSLGMLSALDAQGLIAANWRSEKMSRVRFAGSDDLDDSVLSWREATDFVAMMKYPGARFELGPHGALYATLTTRDVSWPGKDVCFRFSDRVYYADGLTKRKLATLAMAWVIVFQVHEALEHLHIGETRPFQPHRKDSDGLSLAAMVGAVHDAIRVVDQTTPYA